MRLDLPGHPSVAASVTAVRPSQLSTLLVDADAAVQTVEHLLAALGALGIADARIELDGAELPILDGSALPWAHALLEASYTDDSDPSDALADARPLEAPISVAAGEATLDAIPSDELRFTYGIDFPPPLGASTVTFQPRAPADFVAEIAPARSFVMLGDLERLRAAGLIRGGSLANALVCGSSGWLNPPLRFSDEPARHKLLDLIGDLSLLGEIPRAHYIAFKAGHRLHVALARAIAARAT